MILIYLPPITKLLEHLVISILTITVSSSVKCLFICVIHLLNYLVFFRSRGYLYTKYNFASIFFSQFMTCVLTSFISFEIQDLLIMV